jgi:hypothetical protein
MRNLLLCLSLLTSGLVVNAQLAFRDNKLTTKLVERPVVMNNNHHTAAPSHQHRSGRALSAIRHSERIGSAGNLLSIIEGTTNQIDVNDSLNAVVFIHRNDPTLTAGTNVAQYRYDISKNRGNNGTWTNDIGPITVDASIDNVSVNGRFPQAVIYNQAGNTLVDSAHLIYSGTWHDNNTWSGQMRGRGKLSGDVNTYNVHIDPINNKQVAIAAGMCQGPSGTFWAVNAAYNGTFTAGSDAITSGIIVEKGVWNPVTRDVTWTTQTINQAFQGSDNAGATVSIATSFNIAFEPTGQKGWIAILGDITADLDSVYDPIFWKTVDGGANWTGPIHVDLDSIQGIRDAMSPTLVNGDPATMNATASFDADLTVDVNGNPHLLTTVGSGTEYSIQAAGYGVWDITFDPLAIQGCNWKGYHLADIQTLRGTFTNDNPAQTMDNRPLICRSREADKIFFFWCESDAIFLQSTDNDIPNLFGRAIDVTAHTMTPVYNWTEGDTLWGGETSNTGGGVFGGSVFPTVSQTALKNGNTYNIPLVMTQVDYAHDPSQGLGSSEQPAAFWYINDINVPSSDFAQPLDQVPPTVTLLGSDTVTLLVNSHYTEDGATAFDCTDGDLTNQIQVVNAPDTAVVGVYEVLYIATDAAGNSDTVIRTVVIGATPTADFSWSFPTNACKAQFQDLSANLPDHWTWNFGDASGSTVKNPLKTFAHDGTYHVCLTASNGFGTSAQVCKDVTVTGCINGIDEVFASQISMFPNPSTGKVNITVNGNVGPELIVTVYNILGETVVSPAKYRAGTTNMQIDLSNAPSGVYMVKIQNDKESTVKHLTITHK